MELAVAPIHAPVAAGAKSSYNAYEDRHEESFSDCGDYVIDNKKYVLKCSERSIKKTTIAELEKMHRYYVKWGYSGGGNVLPANDYTSTLITSGLTEINQYKVSHRNSAWFCDVSPESKMDDKEIGIFKAYSRTGIINVVNTQGEDYRGMRFYFYDKCYGFEKFAAYPSIVYSPGTLWNMPDWDIEVRAYMSTIDQQSPSKELVQIEIEIASKSLEKFASLFSIEWSPFLPAIATKRPDGIPEHAVKMDANTMELFFPGITIIGEGAEVGEYKETYNPNHSMIFHSVTNDNIEHATWTIREKAGGVDYICIKYARSPGQELCYTVWNAGGREYYFEREGMIYLTRVEGR